MFLSSNLIYLRHKYRLTQNELAHELDISPSAIGMYEQNRREPELRMLIKIARFFNVSIDDLIKKDLQKEES